MSKLSLRNGFLGLAVGALLVGGFLVTKNAIAEEGDPVVPVDPVTTLTVNVTVTGEGSVSSSPAGINCHADSSCTADFSSDVTLTADGYGEHEFYGWAPGVCDSEDEYTCTISLGETSRAVDVSLDFGVTTSISIKKQTTSGDGEFDFTGDISGTLSNDEIVTQIVFPGTYTSTEAAEAGWELASISCSDANSTGNTGTGTATFNVEVGENVICTFTNTPTTPSATGPWYVNAATGSDSNDCNDSGAPCKTIQAAINKASAGDIVNVAAGVYAEHVGIDKALTLNGANSALSCRASRGTESVITGTSTGAVQITADNVTLNGFQVSSGNNDLGSGIWLSGQDNATIKNNLVSQSQIGIYVNDSSDSMINCNVLDGNNESGSAGGSGIYSDTSSGLTVDRNEFKNHLTNSPLLLALNGADSHTDFMFSNNEVHDNDASIYILGVNGGTFEGNNITTGGDKTGLYFDGADANISVTGNTIHDNAYGVLVGDTYGTNSGIVVNLNSFTGNDTLSDSAAVWNYAGYTGTLDATCNWWGATDGPGLAGPGTGDKVTGDVDFSSWLTSDDLSDCTDGEPESGDGGRRRSGGGGGSNNNDDGEVLGASTGPFDGCDDRTTGFSTTTGKSCVGNPGTGQVLGESTFVFTLFLKQGPPYLHMNEVMELQKFLNAGGFGPLVVDGKFGPLTKAAVIKFQLANGLAGDGIVGPLTRAVLNK